MQSLTHKKVIIFIFIFLTALFTSEGQDLKIRLKQADSLYEAKRYTQAYHIYEQMLEQDKHYTPQSLLKMASIHEALGHDGEALHFLNYYYERFPNRKVLLKMEEIASKNELQGYQYNDLEYFSSLYKRFYHEILLALGVLVFLYFLAVVTNKIFIKGISNSRPVFFILFASGLWYFINYGEKYIRRPKAIISKDEVLVMQSPSAASSCVGVITKGTRLTLIDKNDIWYRIELGDSSAYVRMSNFYPL